MRSILVFPDILTVTDFQLKNSDVSRIQGVCHVILWIFFREDITVPSFINVGYM